MRVGERPEKRVPAKNRAKPFGFGTLCCVLPDKMPCVPVVALENIPFGNLLLLLCHQHLLAELGREVKHGERPPL